MCFFVIYYVSEFNLGSKVGVFLLSFFQAIYDVIKTKSLHFTHQKGNLDDMPKDFEFLPNDQFIVSYISDSCGSWILIRF